MAGLLILDGFTLTAKIAARGPWPALTCRYRVALPAAVMTYSEDSRPSAAARMAATVKLLADHLASWDVTDDKGEVLPVTATNLRRVPMAYLDELVNHVSGYSSSAQEEDAKNS
jgi:hypothetical protein